VVAVVNPFGSVKSMLRSRQTRQFLWLWLGQTLIFCATQIWLVALTWLVLQETQSGWAAGSVLMAAAIPRGLLMLLGGAMSDRLPTNRVAALAGAIAALAIAGVVGMLLSDRFSLEGMIALAALFGALEAFLYPAILALLPKLVPAERLSRANAWMQGSEQITNVVGPAAAGLAIGAVGLTATFSLDALLLLLGSLCIFLVQPQTPRRSPHLSQSAPAPALAAEIGEGLRYAWQRSDIRIGLLLIAAINFAILGPIVIGVAQLVTVRLQGNATTFGALQAAYGVGALLGVVIAGQLNAIANLKTPLAWLAGALGLGLMALGFVNSTALAAIAIGGMGLGGGIVGVLAMTWLQQQTAFYMQGRMMSLTMFAAVALDPFSQAVSGALLEVSLTGLFVAAGGVMLLTALGAAIGREAPRST
jgi:MFS family permease